MISEQVHFRLPAAVINYIKDSFVKTGRYTNHSNFIAFATRSYYTKFLEEVTDLMESYAEKMANPYTAGVINDLSMTLQQYLRNKVKRPELTHNEFTNTGEKDPVTIRLPTGMVEEITNLISKLDIYDSIYDFIWHAVQFQIGVELKAAHVAKKIKSMDLD